MHVVAQISEWPAVKAAIIAALEAIDPADVDTLEWQGDSLLIEVEPKSGWRQYEQYGSILRLVIKHSNKAKVADLRDRGFEPTFEPMQL